NIEFVPLFEDTITTDVRRIFSSPGRFVLNQNYPNPFNPTTTISWYSPVSGRQTLKIYDILGNEITTLVNEFKPAGNYEVNFNANGLASGVYFYRIQAGEFTRARKLILLK
ncbi:MAG: T9SS type A sorting domain-containing protein, partial [Ignavibacteriaceae bacterium]